jgi:hypothetical protein
VEDALLCEIGFGKLQVLVALSLESSVEPEEVAGEQKLLAQVEEPPFLLLAGEVRALTLPLPLLQPHLQLLFQE